MSERYNPANKFGHPEDEPAVYYGDEGNRISKREWLQKIGVELPPERATPERATPERATPERATPERATESVED